MSSSPVQSTVFGFGQISNECALSGSGRRARARHIEYKYKHLNIRPTGNDVDVRKSPANLPSPIALVERVEQ